MRKTDTANVLAGTRTLRMIDDLPKAADRGFWDGLPGEVCAALTERGESALDEQIPVLSDYAEFSRNGNRTHFEDGYFRRRLLLTQLVLAECAENGGRFAGRIAEYIRAILDETTWCLPAHNTYVRDAAVLPAPDPERPVIDLFAAETAAILGLAGYLLEDVCASVNDRIDEEIRRRILVPYLTEHFWWMGDGEQLMCNWTSWITQNVLLALFTRREGVFMREDLHKVLAQTARSVDYYLDDYNDDGSCSEGIFYYGHSALCLFGCLDVMDRITAGGMASLWHADRIRRIAAYPVSMYIGDGQYFNFSDASPYAGHRCARDFLFAQMTGNEAYAAFSALDFQAQEMPERLLEGEHDLYADLLQLGCWREMASYPAEQVLPEDVFYADAGLMTARDEHWALAAKAGNNGDIHNHNDVGSVTLYLDRRPFLIDLGVGTYTAKTFSADRYEIWTMQSAYHNTVSFREEDGTFLMQRDGRAYGARDVSCGLCAEEAELAMEFSGAYDDPRVRSARRSVKLIRGAGDADGTVILRDDFHADGSLTPVLTFMTYERPQIIDDPTQVPEFGGWIDREELTHYGRICAVRVGGLGFMIAGGIARILIETCPIEDERLGKAWKHECYRVLADVEKNMSKTVIIRG